MKKLAIGRSVGFSMLVQAMRKNIFKLIEPSTKKAALGQHPPAESWLGEVMVQSGSERPRPASRFNITPVLRNRWTFPKRNGH